MAQTATVEICVAKSRPPDQQSAFDYYTLWLPKGVNLETDERKKSSVELGNKAVFNINNWLILLTTETDPSPI